MQKGAVKREITALHLAVKHFGPNAPSVSTQIATLRRLLQGKIDGALGHYFEKIREVCTIGAVVKRNGSDEADLYAQGRMPLVIEAHNADIIATLIILKKETEADTRKTLKLTITGASEAHLLAKEIAEAGVGIILVPSRGIPVPFEWESRRLSVIYFLERRRPTDSRNIDSLDLHLRLGAPLTPYSTMASSSA